MTYTYTTNESGKTPLEHELDYWANVAVSVAEWEPHDDPNRVHFLQFIVNEEAEILKAAGYELVRVKP